MLAGHFVTAMVAHQKLPARKGLLLFLLIASQLPDLLWFLFHYLGLEVTRPDDFLDINLQTLQVDMTYSHDLVPMFGWMFLLYVVGRLFFQSQAVGLAAALLHFVHILVDDLAGLPHFVFGPDSMSVGFPLYHTAPYLSKLIEAVFSAVLLYYFFSQERKMNVARSTGNKAAIIGLFVFNIVLVLCVADNSLRELFGIPEFEITLTPAVPSMIVSYAAMTWYLHYFLGNTRASGD